MKKNHTDKNVKTPRKSKPEVEIPKIENVKYILDKDALELLCTKYIIKDVYKYILDCVAQKSIIFLNFDIYSKVHRKEQRPVLNFYTSLVEKMYNDCIFDLASFGAYKKAFQPTCARSFFFDILDEDFLLSYDTYILSQFLKTEYSISPKIIVHKNIKITSVLESHYANDKYIGVFSQYNIVNEFIHKYIAFQKILGDVFMITVDDFLRQKEII